MIDFYSDESLKGDPDYFKCSECRVWRHVADAPDDESCHSEQCSHSSLNKNRIQR